MLPVNPQNKTSEKQVEIDGLKINYKTIGAGKTPIVLLHGWGVSSDKYLELARWFHSPPVSRYGTGSGLWNPNAKQNNNGSQKGSTGLSPLWNQRHFQILIPDLPGFGKSEEPKENWDLDDYVEFVDEFIKKINRKGGFELVKNILEKKIAGSIVPQGCGAQVQNGSTGLSPLWSQRTESQRFILIGHSFGGQIAIKYAARYPEKIEKLILTGAAGIKHKLTAKQKAFFIMAKTGKAIFSLPIINNFQKPVYKIFSKMALRRKKDYYNASSQMKEVMKNILAEDLTDYLGKIKSSALLVWGREDKTTPLADGDIMNEKIENSKLVMIDGANHSLPYQKPEEFAEIVGEFLNSTQINTD